MSQELVANDCVDLTVETDVAIILAEYLPAGIGSPTAAAASSNRARVIIRDAANDDDVSEVALVI